MGVETAPEPTPAPDNSVSVSGAPKLKHAGGADGGSGGDIGGGMTGGGADGGAGGGSRGGSGGGVARR